MAQFQIPPDTHLGPVGLQVADLGRALGFYEGILGLKLVDQTDDWTVLSADGTSPGHLWLHEHPVATPKPARTTGLYHFAIRLPDRVELARTLQQLFQASWPLHGFSDHKVSEAIYLADPDGNGVEIYTDRPRSDWPRVDDQIAMSTDPLDVEGLLRSAVQDDRPWTGVHPETDIGHIHLHVSDLARAEAFYHGLLGLDVTQRNYPGALFLSAGGYHHHVGVNIWAGIGAASPPKDAVGLLFFTLCLPDDESAQILQRKARQAHVPLELGTDFTSPTGFTLQDPDGIQVGIQAG